MKEIGEIGEIEEMIHCYVSTQECNITKKVKEMLILLDG